MSSETSAHPLPGEDLFHVLEHTRDLWEEVRGQKIFLTGGTGFFGRWLIESFLFINRELKLNAALCVLSRNPDAFLARHSHLAAQPELQLVQGNITSFPFPEGHFGWVIHAATEASARLNEENPLLMLDTIVTGTRRVLDFSVSCGAKKFLLTSSGAVYGRQPSEMTHMPETHEGGPDPLSPKSAYGEGKRISEYLTSLYAHQHPLEVKIARCFAFVGPGLPLDIHFAMGNFIRDALKGGPIQVAGDGSPWRSYLYSSDLCLWLWTILFKAPSGRAYNVGSGEALTIEETARLVSSVTGNPAVTIAHKKTPGLPASRYVPAVSRAEEEIGLRLRIPLAEGIRKTFFYQKGMERQ